MLFKVHYAWQNGLTAAHSKPCTSTENAWLTPTLRTMEPMKLQDMVFAKPHYVPKKRPVEHSHVARKLFTPNRSRKNTSGPTLDEFTAALLPEIPSAVAFQYALLDSEPSYDISDDINVGTEELCLTSAGPPPTLTQFAQMHSSASDLWNNLPCYSKEQVASLEAATREQSSSDKWKGQRVGRITASKVHSVWTKYKSGSAAAQDCQAVHTLVESIMGKQFTNPNISALKYGTVTEPMAVQVYLSVQQTNHNNLTVAECGLFVLPEHVYAAASPDRLVSCTCCGEGLLEVKCPFSAINQPADNVNVAYLQTVDGKTSLKRSHQYYSQVQFQMGVTGRRWCDFFVYTKSDYFLERVPFDESHWAELLSSAEQFFQTFICSELVKNQ